MSPCDCLATRTRTTITIRYQQDQEQSLMARQLARAVKMFAVIDAIFLVVWSFTYWPLILGVLLAMCGYFGANRFRSGYIIIVRHR